MEFVKSLGEGTYGSVDLFGCKNSDGSTIYKAVKVSSIERYTSLEKEFQLLTKLKGCPRIVQLLGNTKSLVEETDSYGERVVCMSMGYAPVGLVSIHRLGYVHCDLKPDNLLLFPREEKETYELKIADFGVSTKAGEESDCWDVGEPFVGTHVYMSPESVQECKVERTLDLWSLGCIVLEMYTGKCPWYGIDKNGVECNLMYDIAPAVPLYLPSDARQFIDKCFARKPEDRGTASELLLHPFLVGDRKKSEETKRRTISKKPLKIFSPKFKRTSNKTLRLEIGSPRSDSVPV